MKNVQNKLYKKIPILLYLCIGVLCFSINNVFANDFKVIENIAENMQKTYTKMNTFKAIFSQELFHRESETIQKRNGFILFEKPNNIHWETKAPHAELLIMNEKEIWNYLPDEEIAFLYNIKMLETSHVALNIVTGQNKITDDFEIEIISKKNVSKKDANLQKKGYTPLLLYPFEVTTSLVEAILWVDPKTYFIKQVTILDFYGNTNTIFFESLSENVRVQKADFTFKAPKGVLVEDHSKD